ncbi:MAG: DNA primase [Bacteroidota bacterium]
MIPQNKIDEIINAANIEQVIGDYVRLKRKGANLSGLCPFHNEKSPSFSVSPAKGIYKCFGCGKAGNVVNFIMEHDSLGYIPALKFLADKFNIEWPQQEFVNVDEEKKQRDEKESLQILNNWANEYFQKILWENETGQAIGLSYFEERGFRHDIIKKFNLGFSLDSWQALYDDAIANQFKEELLFSSGLVKHREDGKKYDAYRGRVIFPIHNINGKVIAFAGRYLKKEPNSPKYVNSPETLLYHKSNELYGLNYAKNVIRQQDSVYLVEGYTDVISMHQSGVENVVASSGTSLTEGQIRLIKRFTENVTVLFDGDAAGIKASIRGIDMLLEQGLNVRVLTFPDGDDPDSYSQKVGSDEFKVYLETKRQDFIVFKVNLLLSAAGNDPIQKASVTRDIVESISKIPDSIKRSVFVSECSRLLQVDEQVLIVELNKLRKQFLSDKDRQYISELPEQSTNNESSYQNDLQETLDDATIFDSQEQDLIRILVNYADRTLEDNKTAAAYLLEELVTKEIAIEHPIVKLILEETYLALQQGEVVSGSYFTNHQNPLITALTASVISKEYVISPNWEKKAEVNMSLFFKNIKQDIDTAILHLHIKYIDRLMKQNMKVLESIGNEEEEQLHQHLHMDLMKQRTELTKKIGAVIVK